MTEDEKLALLLRGIAIAQRLLPHQVCAEVLGLFAKSPIALRHWDATRAALVQVESRIGTDTDTLACTSSSLHLAEAYSAIHDRDRALDLVRRAEALTHNHISGAGAACYLAAIGATYILLGLEQQAEAVAEDLEWRGNRQTLGLLRAVEYVSAARILRRLGRYGRVLDLFERLPLEERSTAAALLGTDLLAEDAFNPADRGLVRALVSYCGSQPESLVKLGMWYCLAGDRTAALTILSRAAAFLEVHRRSKLAELTAAQMALAYALAGEGRQAERLCTPAGNWRSAPASTIDWGVRAYLGEALIALGKGDVAARLLGGSLYDGGAPFFVLQMLIRRCFQQAHYGFIEEVLEHSLGGSVQDQVVSLVYARAAKEEFGPFDQGAALEQILTLE